jgi:hypothetical protein
VARDLQTPGDLKVAPTKNSHCNHLDMVVLRVHFLQTKLNSRIVQGVVCTPA